MHENYTYIILLSCPDRRGLVHYVSGFLLDKGANIEEAAQFNDQQSGLFFMRLRFVCTGKNIKELELEFSEFAQVFDIKFTLHCANSKIPTLIMVSKQGHCLNDLLFRYKTRLLPIDIRAIISNHRDFYQLAASYNIPFHHLPISSDNKIQMEERQLQIIEEENIELVVLARYMQILSPDLCDKLAGKAINIHHSFLPSFKGAAPYAQAHTRGVKLIGATAHFVTSQLDEGPIIEQDVVRVDHSKSVADFTTLGQDVESLVLSRAVKWFAEHRVILNSNKTLVFK